MTIEERIKEIKRNAESKRNTKIDSILPGENVGNYNFGIHNGRKAQAEEAMLVIQELQNKNKELEAQHEAETMYYESKNENLTRLEVIDESGRVYINNNCKMELSYQDEGRTLKIFVNNEVK